MTRDEKYTPKFKADRALELLTGEKTITELSKTYHMSNRVLAKWKKWLLERGSIVFEKSNQYRDITNVNIEVGNRQYLPRLKELRIKKRLSQKDVGNAIGITQDSYSKYESGLIELPIRRLIQLCQFYKMSIDYMMGMKDE